MAACALGEDEHRVAAIHGFAGVGEAAAEAARVGQREDVEERGEQPVDGRREQVEEEIALIARASEVEQHLAGHGGGDAAAQRAGRESTGSDSYR